MQAVVCEDGLCAAGGVGIISYVGNRGSVIVLLAFQGLPDTYPDQHVIIPAT